jgi:pimeloyl-ACP methyl ester carboxylesterase
MIKSNFIESNIIANGVDIAYQLHGNANNPTVLLVHGLGTPLTGWPTDMVKGFVDKGFQVLLLDNRDIGKSKILAKPSLTYIVWTTIKFKLGFSARVPYQLNDMMEDIIALLDHLQLNKVHLIGASMGGMIAQLLAIHHPNRVQTLTSIMSTTGTKNIPPIDWNIRKQLISIPKSRAYQARLAYHINNWRVVGSPNYPATEQYLTDYVDSLIKRGITIRGTLSQILAILVARNRESLLKSVNIPSLILHGDSDGLVHVDGGKATAKAIPDAQLKIYPGMGHDFPVELVPNIVDDIVQFIFLNNDDNKKIVSDGQSVIDTRLS